MERDNFVWVFSRILTLAFLFFLFAVSSEAQIIRDGTVGPGVEIQPTGPNYIIPEDMGALAGSNLFHSFEEFNILTNESATFTAISPIDNVISRVTGPNISNIDGLLDSSSITGANFWLLNSNGVFFGPNAQVNVDGSFNVGATDSLIFEDGNQLDASSTPPILTSANPVEFGFFGPSSANITLNGSSLGLPNGISLKANGVFLENGGNISASSLGEQAGGNILIEAENIILSGQNQFGFMSFIGSTAGGSGNGGNIDIETNILNLEKGAFISSSTTNNGNAGNLTIKANDISLSGIRFDGSGSSIAAQTLGSGNGGTIDLETNSLRLDNGAFIDASTTNIGNGGNIIIKAGEIVLTGSDQFGFASSLKSLTRGVRDGGEINLDTTSLKLEEGAFISANTLSTGNAGNIFINASEVLLSGPRSDGQGASIVSQSTGTGNGGIIDLKLDSLKINDGSFIDTSTAFLGNGGDIKIQANEIILSGSDALGITSSINSRNLGLNEGGTIEIETGNFSLEDGGAIRTSTEVGNAGDIKIMAKEISLSGTGSFGLGAIIDAKTSATGKGGTIAIETESLNLEDSATINTSTLGSGDAGDLLVKADLISLSGVGGFLGIGSSLNALTQGSGNGGTIDIETSSLILNDGALIDASSENLGNSGDIKIKANEISMSGSNNLFGSSTLRTQTAGAGEGGTIVIETLSLTLEDGATISTTTSGTGNAGDLNVKAGEILLTGNNFITGLGSQITAESQGTGNGGSLEIEAINLELNNAASLSTTTFGPGDADDIKIKANEIVLSGEESIFGLKSSITAETRGTGTGGTIDIQTSFLSLQEGTSISTSSRSVGGVNTGDAGNVNLFGLGGNLDLQGASITTNSDSQGNVGTISITNFSRLNLEDSEISSSSTSLISPAEAGSITVGPGSEILLTRSEIKTESANSFGGTIDLSSGSFIHLKDSQISTNVGAGVGNGGDINLDSNVVSLDNSTISANAIGGNGGDINITTDFLLSNPDSIIQSTSQTGIDGQINVTSPESNTVQGTVALKTAYIDPSQRLRQSCSLKSAGNIGGGLKVAKTRGIPASPEEMLMVYSPEIDIPKTRSGQVELVDIPADKQKFKPFEVASIETAKGLQAFREGDFDQAEENLAQASMLLAQRGNLEQRHSTLRQLAHTQQALGKYSESLETLGLAFQIAEQVGDEEQMASLMVAIGNANLALGNGEEAKAMLTRGMKIATGTSNYDLETASLNSMGNYYVQSGIYQEAMLHYHKSAEVARKSGQKINFAKAVSNEARAALATGSTEQVLQRLDAARQWTLQLDDQIDKAYILIHLAKSYEQLAQTSSKFTKGGYVGAYKSLAKAIEVTESLQEFRARSYALGNLGKLYEDRNRYEEALYLTRQALRSAEQEEAPEMIYLWRWQEGRVLWAMGEKENSLHSYRAAVNILNETRQESLARYGSPRHYFNQSISPVYLDLVNALLQASEASVDPTTINAFLLEARSTVEQLKAAELRAYFKDECVAEYEAHKVSLDKVAKDAAVIYPILLPDRLELLVHLPSGLHRYSVPAGAEETTQAIQRFRSLLEDPGTDEYLELSQKLYDALIRPYSKELAKSGVHTLVFLPHEALNSIPFSALHDGEQFIVQKYAVAVTPSLSLIDPKPLERSKMKLLLAGLSESVQGYPELAAVPQELASIQKLYGGSVLMDQNFTLERFEEELTNDRSLSLVHIASHGSFTGNGFGNFLLAFDGKMSINRLKKSIGKTKFRETPVELLVLSACQTAAGDDQAAFGLAGSAIQAGARSVMGSLWSVSDLGTAQLVEEFYRQLKDPENSKAEALRLAQNKLLAQKEFQHPYFWSPFLMINNWL